MSATTTELGHARENGGSHVLPLLPPGRDLLRTTMKNMTSSESLALAGFVESVLQSFALGGANQTGKALVAALEPGSVAPEVASAYLKLRGAQIV